MKFILKGKKRSAVSPVIATLLLIAIAVAAAIIVYAFVTGLIGGLSSGAGSSLVPVTLNLVVPTGSGVGTLAVTIHNTANNPISGIQVSLGTLNDGTGAPGPNTCIGETAAGGYCNHAGPIACNIVPAANAPVTFCTATGAVIDTASATLPVGSSTSASTPICSAAAPCANLQTGSSFSFTVTVEFSSGSTQTQVVSTTAEL